jgi:2-dehydro-3-deoxyphosphogluconate aldolase/(4S)-4-hydroxy-2-oxoglutarate aldolase
MAAPYKHLGVKFLPLGGVNISNLAEMLSDPLIAAVGGSWLAKPELINAGKFDEIQALAKEAYDVLKTLK